MRFPFRIKDRNIQANFDYLTQDRAGRIVVGAVNSNGTVMYGTAFTVSKPSTGIYDVALKKVFTNSVCLPTITQVLTTVNVIYDIDMANTGPNGFRARFFTPAGTFTDNSFIFHCAELT